ncbi:hypothetical protein AtEden1_Chr5g0117311 [Arabidopsis thaliana]
MRSVVVVLNSSLQSGMACCFYDASRINAEMSCGPRKTISILRNVCVLSVTDQQTCCLVFRKKSWQTLL